MYYVYTTHCYWSLLIAAHVASKQKSKLSMNKHNSISFITGIFESRLPMTTVNSDFSSVSAGMTLIDPDKSTCVGSLKLAIYQHTHAHTVTYVCTSTYVHMYLHIYVNAYLLVGFKIFQLLK